VTEHDIRGSHLLNALQPADRQRLAPHLQELVLPDNHILYEPADKMRHVYFPRDQALAAHIVLMPDGTAIEAAMVGSEGVVEGIVSRGNLPAYCRVSVTHGGDFYRISANVLQDIREKSPQMSDLFARYADCLVAQLLQSIACNATHTIEQRAASWLAAAMDRMGNPDISLTQDQLGTLLGVGRTYVSRVIGRMKGHGVIATRRGGIRIIDRRGLDHASCACRHLVAAHFDEVLKGVYPGVSVN
jgi:CRP-like cAMP-binding protein